MGEKSRNMKNVKGIKLKKKKIKTKEIGNFYRKMGSFSFIYLNTYTEMNNGNYLFI